MADTKEEVKKAVAAEPEVVVLAATILKPGAWIDPNPLASRSNTGLTVDYGAVPQRNASVVRVV